MIVQADTNIPRNTPVRILTETSTVTVITPCTSQYDEVYGFTLRALAAGSNDTWGISTITNGILPHFTTSYPSGTFLYLDTDGSLTDQPGGTRVGRVVASNMLKVDIRQSVRAMKGDSFTLAAIPIPGSLSLTVDNDLWVEGTDYTISSSHVIIPAYEVAPEARIKVSYLVAT